MRRLGTALLLLATLSAAPARALDLPPLCKALNGMGEETRGSGQPIRISAGADLGAPGDCRPAGPSAAARAFCDAAASADGLAWRIYDCENNMSSDAKISTRAEHAERRFRKAITHMTFNLGHGAHFDLTEASGRYDIVVWAVK